MLIKIECETRSKGDSLKAYNEAVSINSLIVFSSVSALSRWLVTMFVFFFVKYEVE